MADFAIWVSACEGALGLERGEALDIYRANCVEARNLALEASPVYEPLREVARAGFSGTSSELLFLLTRLASDGTRRSQRWPKAPNALSGVLRRNGRQPTLQRNRDLFRACRPLGQTHDIGEIGLSGPGKIVSTVSAINTARSGPKLLCSKMLFGTCLRMIAALTMLTMFSKART